MYMPLDAVIYPPLSNKDLKELLFEDEILDRRFSY